jgi:hypothetical protein
MRAKTAIFSEHAPETDYCSLLQARVCKPDAQALAMDEEEQPKPDRETRSPCGSSSCPARCRRKGRGAPATSLAPRQLQQSTGIGVEHARSATRRFAGPSLTFPAPITRPRKSWCPGAILHTGHVRTESTHVALPPVAAGSTPSTSASPACVDCISARARGPRDRGAPADEQAPEILAAPSGERCRLASSA